MINQKMPRVWHLPSYILFGIWNDEVGCVGNAEEEGGWKKNNGTSILWFQ